MAISTPTTASSYLFPRAPSLSSPLHFRHHLSTPSPHSLSFSSSATSSSSEPSRLSPAPLAQAPAHRFDFDDEIARLRILRAHLRNANSLRDKLRVLNADRRVRAFFRSGRHLPSLDMKDEFLIKCLVSAGQAHVLGSELHRGGGGGVGNRGLKEALFVLADMIGRWRFDGVGIEVEGIRSCGMRERFEKLLKTLNDVEEFYDCVGGIIG